MKNKTKPIKTVYQLLFDYPLENEEEIVLFPMNYKRVQLCKYKFNCFKTKREAMEARRMIVGVLRGWTL